jgi:hypothetical protein
LNPHDISPNSISKRAKLGAQNWNLQLALALARYRVLFN